MKNIDKNVWIVAGIVVVFLIVLFARGQFKGNEEEMVLNDNIEIEGTEDTTGTPEKPVTTPKAPTLSYAQALATYKDKIIQLDATCQASPDNSTYKNGTSIMIDNRSAMTRTVKVGDIFTIKPWGFKIVKLYSNTLPVNWYVDCDNSQNVSTILIQK